MPQVQNDRTLQLGVRRRFQESATRRGTPKRQGVGSVKSPEPTPSARAESEEEEEITINSLETESALLAKCTINNLTLHTVVDTGANRTIISENMLKKIAISQDMVETIKLYAAGQGQTFAGKRIGPVKLQLGKTKLYIPIIVAPIRDTMLLGMDVLRKIGAKIDIPNMTMEFNGEQIPLKSKKNMERKKQKSKETKGGNWKERPAVLQEDVILKASAVTQVHIPLEGWDSKGTMLVEPDQDSTITIARAIYANTTSPAICCINTSDKNVRLKKGTVIGTIRRLTAGDIVKEKGPTLNRVEQPQGDKIPEKPGELPEKLRTLWESAGEGNLTEEQKERLKQTLIKYADTFADNDQDLGEFSEITHTIETEEVTPIKLPLRRTPYHFQQEEEKVLNSMLEEKIISPSKSSWAAAPVLVKKKTGEYRYCIDYRALNKVTKKDVYPIPLMTECIDALGDNKFFSKLDCNQAYWQISVDKETRHKTAFRTRHGLWEFNKLPYGLANAPSTYCRAMALVLQGLGWETVLAFLDDIIILGATFDQHLENLEKVLERFQRYKLKLKPRKCELVKTRTEFLGRKVGQNGVTLTDHSIETILQWEKPTTFKKVQSFLGLTNFHRQFIKGYAKIAEPLQEIVRNKKYKWGKDQEEAFNTLKEKLSSPPVLGIPNKEGRYTLDTDSSGYAVGAELLQEQGGKLVTIGYGSYGLTKTQRKYCATKRELLAVVRFTDHFKHYLLGREFTVRTDHHSLIWLTNFKELSGQVARWAESLSRFCMQIEHRPGATHLNADALSRPQGPICPQDLPCHGCPTCVKISHQWTEFEEKVDNVQELTENMGSIRRTEEGIDISWPLEVHCIRQVTANAINSIEENQERVQEAQERDPDLRFLRGWLDRREEPETQEIELGNPEQKFYWSNRELFYKEGNCIYKQTDMGPRLVVPKELREEILELTHSTPIGGHQGVQRTKDKIKQGYYWRGISRDTANFVRKCRECSRNKKGRKSTYPLTLNHAGIPMEKVHLDFIGPLPKSRRGNEHILMITDNFTKYVEAIPLPNQTAETTARAAVDQVFTRLGFPTQIVTDQGRNFEAQLFLEICRLLKINKTRTTPYRPKANGQCERTNRTLIEAVRCTLGEYKDRWDEHLPQICMAIRSAVNRTTGQTPNKMMLGRELNTPVNLMIPSNNRKAMVPEEYPEFLEDSLQRAHQAAREKIKTEIKRSKAYHDIRTYQKEYKVGDVILWIDKARINKLHPVYLGPAVITHQLSPCTFRILVNNYNSKVVNHDLIKRCEDEQVPGWILRRREEAIKNQEELHCICKKPDDGFFMIQCNKCLGWYHGACVGQSKGNMRNTYFCPKCA